MTVKSVLSMALLLAGISMADAAQRTIVGVWKIDGSQCLPPSGALLVGPKSLAMDEMVCTFDSVSRKGSTVSWTGECNWSDGFAMQDVVVRATERKGVLSISMDGDPFPHVFRRCTAAESAWARQ
ncbi:MAG: hypothetical protein MUC58_07790 [Rhizobiaceae bacterium]|nr:hypothetical protein [Rhizobiaceae bacterium]